MHAHTRIMTVYNGLYLYIYKLSKSTSSDIKTDFSFFFFLCLSTHCFKRMSLPKTTCLASVHFKTVLVGTNFLCI